MTKQLLAPVYMNKDQFLTVLDDIKNYVTQDDSFEGSLSYEFPWSTECGDPVTDPKGPGFRVSASYRIGSQGQGDVRIVGEWIDIVELPKNVD